MIIEQIHFPLAPRSVNSSDNGWMLFAGFLIAGIITGIYFLKKKAKDEVNQEK